MARRIQHCDAHNSILRFLLVDVFLHRRAPIGLSRVVDGMNRPLIVSTSGVEWWCGWMSRLCQRNPYYNCGARALVYMLEWRVFRRCHGAKDSRNMSAADATVHVHPLPLSVRKFEEFMKQHLVSIAFKFSDPARYALSKPESPRCRT